VTAGNSSSLNDGAAAVLVTSRRFADEHGLPVLATITATATAGVPPRIMGIGPVPATAKALERTGLTLGDVDLIELNEAFAAQSLAVLREWGIDAEDHRLNVNGGAIALGHPLGCSGARLVTTLVHELERRPTPLSAGRDARRAATPRRLRASLWRLTACAARGPPLRCGAAPPDPRGACRPRCVG
jgi:acetyl-CoA acyltransferase